MPAVDQNQFGTGLPPQGQLSGVGIPFTRPPDLPAFNPDVGAPAAADPLAPVMKKIAAGESGGPDPYHQLYGGGSFGFPQWAGAPGPQGVSHAAGKYQFEPATWNAAAKGWLAQNPGQPPPDFANPQDQEKVARYWASKTYKDKTGRDLAADAAAGNVDYSALAGQWPSLGTAGAGMAGMAERVRQDKYAEAADLTKAAQAAIKQIGEMGGDISAAMKRVREAQDRSDKAQDAALEAVSKAPAKPELDAVQHMGSLATIVGIFGGLLTRAPMRASINAAASAIESYNQGDLDNYKISYNNWKTQTDMLFGIAKMNAERVRDIMFDEKMGQDERRALLDVTLRAAGLTQLADAARTQGDMVPLEWAEKMAALEQQKALRMAQIEAIHANHVQTLENKWQVLTDPTTKDQTGNPVPYRYNPATGEATTLDGSQPYHPGGAQKMGAQGAGQPLSAEAIDLAARRALQGDTHAVQGLGYGTVGANNRTAITNKMAEIAKSMGLTPEQVAIKQNEFRGQAAEFQTLGRRTAAIETAVQELSNTVPALITASENVDRTQVPAINRALIAAERGTGDENVIKFGLALNAVMKAYAQAMNPTGIARVSDFERAEELLSTAWSKGQIKAGTDQLGIEIRAAQSAPKDVWDRIVSEAGDRARGPLLSGKPPAGGSAPAAAQGGVVMFNGKRFSEVPSGAIDVPPEMANVPDGKVVGDDTSHYVKRGNRLILLVPAQ